MVPRWYSVGLEVDGTIKGSMRGKTGGTRLEKDFSKVMVLRWNLIQVRGLLTQRSRNRGVGFSCYVNAYHPSPTVKHRDPVLCECILPPPHFKKTGTLCCVNAYNPPHCKKTGILCNVNA